MSALSGVRSERPLGRLLTLVAIALVGTLALVPTPIAVADGGTAPTPAVRALCGDPAAGTARCHALVRTDVRWSARPFATAGAAATPAKAAPLYPADLQAAYGLTAAAQSRGAGVKVAVVDAYDDPTAEADLAVYRAATSLPPCTSANGCFTKVDQDGGTAYPTADTGWAQEAALDLAMVSAICPNCSLVLVEADSDSIADLGVAVNRAVSMGATFISNSYGVYESPKETAWDTTWFTHPGVVITAPTGDDGYGVQFPAASPHVVAVGGTSLTRGPGGTWTQSAWSGAGSGCSLYEPKPSWQTDAGCAHRTVADVSAVADPSTGVGVYYHGYWYTMGGTSAAAPIVAAAYALAGSTSGTAPASFPYYRGGLTDVVGGSNGSCTQAYLCTAVVGYDGPTGLGTPMGTTPFAAFGAPGQPQNVSAVPGNGSASLSWSAPSDDGGSALTGYTATASPGGATCSATPPTTTCTVAGLSNGKSYTFTVRASNAAGASPPSTASTSVIPRTLPGPPIDVAAQAGDASAIVTWSAPASDGGAAITRYTVTATPGGAACTWTTGPLACIVADLANLQGYTFTVVATNAAGDGPASSPSATATPVPPPAAPTAVTAALPATPVAGSLDISWTGGRGGAPVTSYTATAYASGTLATTGRSCTTVGSPPAARCTIAGLTPGVAVVVQVVASAAAALSQTSAPSAPITPPMPPTAVIGSLPVWSVATSVSVPLVGVPGTNTMTGYDVRFRRASWNGSFGSFSYQSTSKPTLALPVAAGSTYCFSVRARDALGYASTSWSPERCTAVPLDDRSLTRHGPWTSTTGSAYYLSTSSRSSAYGASLVRTSVKARRIAIVATTCPTCGSIRVYWGATLVRTISLRSSTTANGRTIAVVAFTSVRSGTVTVKVATSRRNVLIDGIAISRT